MCDSVITNQRSIDRGMGPECAEVVHAAKMKAAFTDEDFRLEYNWLIEVRIIRALFVETFCNTKFRSAFRKGFYASISDPSRDRVSRKQLTIMYDMLFQKLGNLEKYTDQILAEKKAALNNKCKGLDLSALIHVARAELRSSKV